MRFPHILPVAFLCTNCAVAAELGPSDAGAFGVVGKDGQLSSLSYR